MANRKKEVYKPKPMTEGKRNIIQGLLQEYDIETADDIQDALKDLLSGTLKEMMESVLNSLKNRGVQDILILCSDGLAGMKDAISPIFKFSKDVRTAFYTTNVIESLNASYRRLNRQRSVFTSSQALLKALYLATFEATKKWTMPIRNWGKVRGELTIMYPDRMPD